MMENNKSTIIFIASTFIAITILSIILFLQLGKLTSISKNEDSKNIGQNEVTNSINNTENNGDYLSVDKYILDDNLLSIKITKVYKDETDGNICIDTYITNNTGENIKVTTGETYINDIKSNVKYNFTLDKDESLNKTMVISDVDLANFKVVTCLKIIDPFEETALYKSDNIVIKVEDNKVTVIKSTGLMSLEFEHENEIKTEIEDKDEPEIESETEIEDKDEPEIESNINTETENNNESIMSKENNETEVETESTDNKVINTYTTIGDYKYGFFSLPGEFKLASEDGDYKQYKSSEFIDVRINYKEDTSVEDYCKDFVIKNYETMPDIEFKDLNTIRVDAYKDKETQEVLVKISEEEIDITNAELGKYNVRIKAFVAGLEKGNYALFVMTVPDKEDLLVLDIFMPYELGEYFTEFSHEVLDSFEFKQ